MPFFFFFKRSDLIQENLSRKGSDDHKKNPNKNQQFLKGKAAEALHKAYCTHLNSCRLSCLHPYRPDQIFAVTHLKTCLLESFECHFSQLRLLSCKKKLRCKLFFPEVVFSVKGLCTCGKWIPGFCAWKIRAFSFGEIHLVSPENLKKPFRRKGPCLLAWERVKEKRSDTFFLLSWGI